MEHFKNISLSIATGNCSIHGYKGKSTLFNLTGEEYKRRGVSRFFISPTSRQWDLEIKCCHNLKGNSIRHLVEHTNMIDACLRCVECCYYNISLDKILYTYVFTLVNSLKYIITHINP